ncbi:glutamine-rich protein 2-like [Boleophthalmus pectinirostris]|uniref:glutamine-rich protein 2-like n=1 Tax=Boleophthalmus pectinirostris TaxID=150288 RepID=UPI002431DC7F|nr:glutamine-rich protein 2-like [Boleophthalmus pectinirostris]
MLTEQVPPGAKKPVVQLLTLPTSPSFQPHRSLRPFTVYTLEQIRQHCRSLSPTNRFMYQLSSISRKREQLQKSYEGLNQNQPDRVVEVADYSLYSVSRSCGGSHTVTSFNQRQRSSVQHSSQQSRLLAQLDDTLGQSEEVDIVGLDGHIYKGRLNASPSKNAETKLPTIASRDGSSRSRSRPRSSPSPRDSAPSSGLRRPSPPSGCCSSGRDWPVSPLGCASQSSLVPMSVNAAESST